MKFLTNRDPVFLVAAIQSVLALLLSFGALGFVGLTTQGDLALLVGVLNAAAALYLAATTSETLLAPLIEMVKAGLAFGAIYGLSITIEQTGLLIGAITALFAAYQRTQVEPLASPSLAVDGVYAITNVPDTSTLHGETGGEVLDSYEYYQDDLEGQAVSGNPQPPVESPGLEFPSHTVTDERPDEDEPEPPQDSWPGHDR